MKRNNIVLIGFMGTGKSTVGHALADEMAWDLIDTDSIIEEQEGMSIPELFTLRGERMFRETEKRVIHSVMQRSGQIVSTGGGAVLREDNRARMLANGFVVALKADAETIISRVKDDHNRPLLEGDREARVRELLEKRKHSYDFADMIMDTSSLSIQEITRQILHRRKEAMNESFSSN